MNNRLIILIVVLAIFVGQIVSHWDEDDNDYGPRSVRRYPRYGARRVGRGRGGARGRAGRGRDLDDDDGGGDQGVGYFGTGDGYGRHL